MKAIPLTVPFKGERNYIHSTDVYVDILRGLEEHERIPIDGITDVDFVFRRVCRQRVQMTRDRQQDSDAVATFSFRYRGEPQQWQLYERDIPVSDRVPCHEADVIARSCIDAEGQVIAAPYADGPRATLIETIVALNKALHLDVFSEARGKWLFTQVQSERALRDPRPEEIRIHLAKQFGLRLTKSEILFDGALFGHIFFSHVKS